MKFLAFVPVEPERKRKKKSRPIHRDTFERFTDLTEDDLGYDLALV